MKFSLELRARASQDQSIEQKHARFVASLLQIPTPWGFKKQNVPPAPDPGAELVACFSLGDFLGTVGEGDVCYQFRRPFRNESSHDDFLDLTFDAQRIDFSALAYKVFPQYLAAFEPYLGACDSDSSGRPPKIA